MMPRIQPPVPAPPPPSGSDSVPATEPFRRAPSRTAAAPRAAALAGLAGLLLALAGCEGSVVDPRDATEERAEDERADLPLVAFLGDSLTAGHGLAKGQAYPALVQAELAADGHDFRLINSGVSGDTTAGGLARLDWLLRQEPDVLVVCLGANDGLRGLPLEQMEANLRAIVERARAAGARVLFAGMRLPPNYGPGYVREFEAVFPRLAAELDVAFVPFLLDGVAADPALNQGDGIHPNAAGQARIAELLAEPLSELLDALPGS